MDFLSFIPKRAQWPLALVGAGVLAVTGWWRIEASAEEVAAKKVDAVVNKAMIDGAREAAAQAVKEQLPAIAKEVAKQVAEEVKAAQAEQLKSVTVSPK